MTNQSAGAIDQPPVSERRSVRTWATRRAVVQTVALLVGAAYMATRPALAGDSYHFEIERQLTGNESADDIYFLSTFPLPPLSFWSKLLNNANEGSGGCEWVGVDRSEWSKTEWAGPIFQLHTVGPRSFLDGKADQKDGRPPPKVRVVEPWSARRGHVPHVGLLISGDQIVELTRALGRDEIHIRCTLIVTEKATGAEQARSTNVLKVQLANATAGGGPAAVPAPPGGGVPAPPGSGAAGPPPTVLPQPALGG